MGIGLMELVAYGKMNKDVFNNSPQFSFFKKAYIAHTPFFKYHLKLNDNNINLNKESVLNTSIIIDQNNGDLLSNITMELKLISDNDEEIDTSQFIRGFAVGIIDKIDLSIGEKSIEYLNPDIINIYNELWLKETKRQYNDYLVGNKIQPGQRSFSVKLPFYFSRSYCKSLPLCALKYHDVKLDIFFKNINDVIRKDYKKEEQNSFTGNNTTITDINISNKFTENFNMEINFTGEFITISDKERQYFRNYTLEYVYEYIENCGNINQVNNNNNININDDCLVNEIYALFQYLDGNKKPYNNEILKYNTIGQNSNFYFKLNGVGHKLDNFNGTTFFLIDQNIKYHSNVPRTKQYIPVISSEKIELLLNNPVYKSNSILLKKELNNAIQHIEIDEGQYIYTYNYCLEPENAVQPTGGINLSKIDKFTFIISNVDSNVINKHIKENYKLYFKYYSKKYNLLRIMNGMCQKCYQY